MKFIFEVIVSGVGIVLISFCIYNVRKEIKAYKKIDKRINHLNARIDNLFKN